MKETRRGVVENEVKNKKRNHKRLLIMHLFIKFIMKEGGTPPVCLHY